MKQIKQGHLSAPFKRCSLCGYTWNSMEEFLNDKTVVLNGYQWNRYNVKLQSGTGGLLLFTHHHADCGTTLALAASKFKEEFPFARVRKNVSSKPVQVSSKNLSPKPAFDGLNFSI